MLSSTVELHVSPSVLGSIGSKAILFNTELQIWLLLRTGGLGEKEHVLLSSYIRVPERIATAPCAEKQAQRHQASLYGQRFDR